MKRTILSSFVAAALGCASAGAEAQTPLDFDYVASGPAGARPALVFNDGKDTWIQPGSGREIEVVGMPSRRSGPYLVVPGIPERIVVSSGGATGVIARASSPEVWTPPSVRCAEQTAHVSFQRLRSYPDERGERAIASIIHEAKRAERIVVTGRPDAKSRTLAENRARRVRERLIASGVPDAIIETRVELKPSPGHEAEVEMRMPCRIVPNHPKTDRPGPIPAQATGNPAPMPNAGNASPAASKGAAEPAPARNEAPVTADVPPPAMAGSPASEVRAADQAPQAQNDQTHSAPPSATLAIRSGERLSQALRAFLALHGVGLEWRAKTDLEITRETEIGGADWKKTTAAAMKAAGLSAVLVRENNTVYVTDRQER